MTASAFLARLGSALASRRAEKRIRALLAGAIAISCGLMLHQYSIQSDRAPFVGVDDALANVAVNIAEAGRNGFPASPFQAPSDDPYIPRHKSQFNYGSAPFSFMALFAWLFGPTYAAIRAHYVAGLIVSIGAALWIYWRRHPYIAAVFAFAIAFLVWPSLWPMTRPDLIAAVIGLFAVAAAMLASLRPERLTPWFLSGFFAATAFFSHQVLFGLAPWLFLTWLANYPRKDKSRARAHFMAFMAVGVGVGAGALLYFWAIEFRLGDLLQFYNDYAHFVGARATGLGYADFAADFWTMTWSGRLQHLQAPVLGLIGLGVASAVSLVGFPEFKEAKALLAPAAGAAISQQFCLGFYQNLHAGYVIFNQLAWIWAALAALAVIVMALRVHIGASARLFRVFASLIALAVFPFAYAAADAAGTPWMKAAVGAIPFSKYQDRAFEEVPASATAYGDVQFGLSSGAGRRTVISPHEALTALIAFDPAARAAYAPDFFVVNDMRRWDFLGLIQGNAVSLKVKLEALSRGNYRLTSIVYAEPYGETRVFARMTREGGEHVPLASVHDAASDTWKTRLVASPFEVMPADKFSLGYQGASKDATDALTMTLETADYLVEMGATAGEALGPGHIVAVPHGADALDLSQSNSLGRTALAEVGAADRSAFLLLRSDGRPFDIGRFSKTDSSGLEVRSVWRILSSPVPPQGKALPVPDVSDWQFKAARGKLAAVAGVSRVVGDGSQNGYQLIAGPLPVPAASSLVVDFRLASASGAQGLGALARDKSRWLGPPVSRPPLVIETGEETKIYLVVVNSNASDKAPPSRFDFEMLSMRARSHLPYTDEIMTCINYKKPEAAEAVCGPDTLHAKSIPVPDGGAWKLAAPRGKVGHVRGVLNVEGDDSQQGYQLVAGPVAVPSASSVTVDFSLRAFSGAQGLGALTADGGRWVAAPVAEGPLVIETGKEKNMQLVVANMNGSDGAPPSRFEFEIRSMNAVAQARRASSRQPPICVNGQMAAEESCGPEASLLANPGCFCIEEAERIRELKALGRG
ncbi:MAG: hypothetical protein ABL957_03455 [Parvularculaceae bacterium]